MTTTRREVHAKPFPLLPSLIVPQVSTTRSPWTHNHIFPPPVSYILSTIHFFFLRTNILSLPLIRLPVAPRAARFQCAVPSITFLSSSPGGSETRFFPASFLRAVSSPSVLIDRFFPPVKAIPAGFDFVLGDGLLTTCTSRTVCTRDCRITTQNNYWFCTGGKKTPLLQR